MKRLVQRKVAHIGDVPVLGRKALTTNRNERRRGVHAFDLQIAFDEVSRDRLTAPTAEIEYRRVLGQEGDESIEPRTLIPAYAAPIGNVVMGIALIEIDDVVGQRRAIQPGAS